jgi:hypothetical protein
VYYDQLMKLKKDIDVKVVQVKYATGTSDKDYTLTKVPAMIGCVFSQECMPEDEKLWKCVFCGHDSITVPTEDERMEERNRKKDHEYSVNLALWEKFEKDRTKAINAGLAPPPFPTNRFKNNSEIKRKPPKLTVKTYEQPRLLCTCLNSSCVRETKVGNTSVAKCRIWEPGDVEHAMFLATNPFRCRHEWQDNQCTCPICKCPCASVLATSCIMLQQSQGSFMQVLKYRPVSLSHLLRWK